MTFIQEPAARAFNVNPIQILRDMVENYRAAAEIRAEYNRIVYELSALSDRELNDIGIARGMIHEIARQHVEM